MSENTLKSKLKVAVKCAAFKYLIELQQKHSKSKYLVYSDLKLQDYMRSGRSLTIDQKAQLFHIRSRMLDLKTNFKLSQETIVCSLCRGDTTTPPLMWSPDQSQPHLQ